MNGIKKFGSDVPWPKKTEIFKALIHKVVIRNIGNPPCKAPSTIPGTW